MTDSKVWSNAETDLLKLFCTKGLSASQIAGELPGRTPNMVVGRLHRLWRRDKTSPRLCDTPKSTSPTKRAQVAQYKSRRAMPLPEDMPAPVLEKTDKTALDVELYKPGRRIEPYAFVADPIREDDIRASRITVLDLRESMCRYPVDAVGERFSFFFCGEETAIDQSWCAHHFKLTHNQNLIRRTMW